MPEIELGSQLKLYYFDPNPGGTQNVLLLHGLGVCADSWAFQIPVLVESGFRVLAPDIPGFGRSPFINGRPSIAGFAKWMSSFLEATQAFPAVVIGISMGGAIALQLACDYPQMVDKIILVNTFARIQLKGFRQWFYFTTRYFLIHILGIDTQARYVANRLFPNEELANLRQEMINQVMMSNPRSYRGCMRALAAFNLLGCLDDIRVPTLVVTGANDKTVAPENQHVLTERIPGAHEVVIQDAGHAVIAEKPDIFNQVMLRFLASQQLDSNWQPSLA